MLLNPYRYSHEFHKEMHLCAKYIQPFEFDIIYFPNPSNNNL